MQVAARRLLIIPSLLVLTLSAQAQYDVSHPPSAAKLKADNQKVTGSIRSDKAKSRAYCELMSIGAQIEQADEHNDNKKLLALGRRTNELVEQLGQEYQELLNALAYVEVNRPAEFKDLQSMWEPIKATCSH
jgi:phage-related minor tail protein